MVTLERLTQRKEQISPVIEKEMEKFLGVTVRQINEDISNKLISGNLDFEIDLSIPFKKAKEEFKKEFLIRLLQFTNGNISEAARIGAIDRRSIHRLIQKFKIKVEGFRDQPYLFEDDKKEMYVKTVVEKILDKYELTKQIEIDEETAKNITKRLPDIRVTFEEAIDLFEKAYLEEALEQHKDITKAAKAVGLRYETLHKKAKEHGLR
ncbi:hypothetical protein KY326_04750 [Candidatus Woesearchaeota archaeon]|nr:hypothetical protein [Candidatus Woesearchaeota archaeon]